MKTLIFAFCLLLSSSLLANPAVESRVRVLGSIAHGHEVHKDLEGKTAYALMQSLAKKLSFDEFEENFITRPTPHDVLIADGIGWSQLDSELATDLFLQMDPSAYKKERLARALIKELSRISGVRFGMTDNSSRYCGILFRGLLVIDSRNSTIYEVFLTESGSC